MSTPDTLKALTIHQPFSHLIVTPQSELPAGAVQKRIENRKWQPPYFGSLLIHAGKSLDWFDEADWPPTPEHRPLKLADFPEMAFGAIVGIVNLAGVAHIDTIRSGAFLGRHEWVRKHRHAEGPWCWILENARRFEEPIPYRGQQGLFDVPVDVVREQLEKV